MYTRAVALASLFVVASLSLALTQDAPKSTVLPEVVVTAPTEKAAPRRPTSARLATDRTPPKVRSAGPIGNVLQDSPGISIKQGNGPRDVGISIRPSTPPLPSIAGSRSRSI
jgi:hypothetical protein